jgi:hypothetical protein
MSGINKKMTQVVDWSAAVWSGVISGVIFLAISMLLTYIYIGSPWVINRLIASVVMGPNVLPPPATFDATIFIVSIIVQLLLSLTFACIIAIIFHRWGLLVGVIGGGLFGLALYFINFYTFSLIFPWFFLMKSWIMVVSHVVFGALAGGIYEALEVEKFVTVEE